MAVITSPHLCLTLAVQSSEEAPVITIRQLRRAAKAEHLSGTFGGIFRIFCTTFRFGTLSFSGQFRSADAPS